MSIFDFNDGDYCMDMGGGMMMDTEGHLMQSMGSGMALDLESGDLHLVDDNSFSDDDNNW